LEFELTLLSFGDEKEIIPDKGIMKKVIKEGNDYLTPSYETKCLVHIKTYNTSNPSVVYEDIQTELVVGDENMTQGLEKALCTMKKGEKSLFRVSPTYGYGEKATKKGDLEIPPNSFISYEIEILNFEKEKEAWELDNFTERKEAAVKRKTEGNSYYSNNKYNIAIRKYNRAIELVGFKSGLESSEAAEVTKEIDLPCHGNIAQCYLKEKDFKKALEHANKVLEIEKDNAKGLWRRGEAYIGLTEVEKAVEDFKAAMAIQPTDKGIQQSLKKAQQASQEIKAKEKDMWKKAFQ